MNNIWNRSAVSTVGAAKLRDDRLTMYCDIFRRIVRSTRQYLCVQIITYLLMSYCMFWSLMNAKGLIELLLYAFFPIAGIIVTAGRRDMKGNLIGMIIDVVSVAVYLYYHAMGVPQLVFLSGSLVIHSIRAQKLYCLSLIKDLYGFPRFSSFDICNYITGDDRFADTVALSYERVFDNELMKYERSRHFIPRFFKKLQLVAVAAIVMGVGAVCFASSVTGKIKAAENVNSIANKTSGAVKGNVTRIQSVKSYGVEGLTDDEYWVSFGGQQVCFSVPQSKTDAFEAMLSYQHPGEFHSRRKKGIRPSSEPIDFVGEVVSIDDSEKTKSKLEAAGITAENASAYNKDYYIRVYSTSFYETVQRIGTLTLIIGAFVWSGTILLGSLEKRRF